MPSRYSLFKSNKSQASLLSSHEARSQHASPIETPLQSPGFPPASHGDGSNDNYDQQDLTRYYQGGLPARSQSQRVPSSNYPSIHLVRPAHSGAEPPAFDEDDPHSFYNTPSTTNTKSEQDTKRSKRSFFGIGHSGSSKDSPSNSSATHQHSSNPLGRSISVRRKTPVHLSPADREHEQQKWPASQSAVPRLTPSSEEEDGGARLDRLLQETAKPIPSIPPKDPLRSPGLPPPTHQPPQQMREPLQRVNTDSSARQSYQRRDDYESPQRDPSQPSTQQPQLQAFQPPHPNTYHPFQNQRPIDITSQHPSQQHLDNQRIRPPSQQSYDPPSPAIGSYRAYDPLAESQQSRNTLQSISSQYGQSSMAPPSGQPPQTRRSAELNQNNAQSGPPQGGGNVHVYGQGAQAQTQPSSAATGQYPGPPPPSTQPGGNYRSPPPAQATATQQALGEQGRSTPPPGKSRDEVVSLDMAQLLARQDELRKCRSKLIRSSIIAICLLFDFRGQV